MPCASVAGVDGRLRWPRHYRYHCPIRPFPSRLSERSEEFVRGDEEGKRLEVEDAYAHLIVVVTVRIEDHASTEGTCKNNMLTFEMHSQCVGEQR